MCVYYYNINIVPAVSHVLIVLSLRYPNDQMTAVPIFTVREQNDAKKCTTINLLY